MLTHTAVCYISCINELVIKTVGLGLVIKKFNFFPDVLHIYLQHICLTTWNTTLASHFVL